MKADGSRTNLEKRYDRSKYGGRELVNGYDGLADPDEVDLYRKARTCPAGADRQLYAAVWLATSRQHRIVELVTTCCAKPAFKPVANVVDVPGVGAVMTPATMPTPVVAQADGTVTSFANTTVDLERNDPVTWPWLVGSDRFPDVRCVRCGHALDVDAERVTVALDRYRITRRKVRDAVGRRS